MLGWPFHILLGNQVINKNHKLTIIGNEIHGGGIVGRTGLYLDGSENYAYVLMTESVHTSFSATFWLNPDDVQNGKRMD